MIAKNDVIRYKPHLEQLSKHHPTSIHNQATQSTGKAAPKVNRTQT